MEGTIKNFRMGMHHQETAHLIVVVPTVDSRSKAAKYVGKKVVWTSPAGKKINGEIKSPHGNNGAVRVIFERSLPGQSIGKKVKVE